MSLTHDQGTTIPISLHIKPSSYMNNIDVADGLRVGATYQQVFNQAKQDLRASALPGISSIILASSKFFTKFPVLLLP